MKVMVTGASGSLGQAVVEQFRENHRVMPFGHRHQANPETRALDLRDIAALRAELEAGAPDMVIHCAAYRDPDFCEMNQEEARRLNVTPVRAMTDVLPASARLIFISSDYVFDGQQPPYAEDAERRPINFYGQTKMEAEEIALERPSSVVLRIPLLMGCGPTFEESGFIAKMMQALEGNEPVMFDHLTMRYPTDIHDVAALLDFLVDRQASGVFHWSGTEGKTQYDWAVELGAAINRSLSHVTPAPDGIKRDAYRPLDSHLAIDRARALGFDRQTPFLEVVRQIRALRESSPE